MALRIDLGHAQGDRALGAFEGVAQIDLDLGVMVLALRVELALGAAEAAATESAAAAALPAHAAEHLLEEV